MEIFEFSKEVKTTDGFLKAILFSKYDSDEDGFFGLMSAVFIRMIKSK